MSKVNSLIAKFESLKDGAVPVPSASKINSASAKAKTPNLDKKDKFLTAVVSGFQQHLQAAHGKLVIATNRVGRLTSHLEQAHCTIVALKKENEKLEKEANTYYEKFKTHQQRAIRAERCLLKDPIWSGFLMERAIKETEEMKKKRQQDD